MSIKTYLLDSDLAEWTAAEFMDPMTVLGAEGVFDISAADTDFEVTESTPNAMTVDVAIGAALISYLKNGVTWKVIVKSNAVEVGTITANATGSNRVDAIVIHLTQSEATALKTNVAEVSVVLGDGVSALSDADIDTAVGDTNWYRLADVTVPDGASTITNSDIADTRARVTLDALPADGGTTYVTLSGGNQEITTGIKTFPDDGAASKTNAAPTAEKSFANKKYVDDEVIASGDYRATTLTRGETIDGASTPQPCYISDGTNGRDDGKIYMSDANDDTNEARKFYGFVTDDGDADDTTGVERGVVDGFTGLDPDAYYYVQDAVGTVGTSVGSSEICVGKAISATQIDTDDRPEGMQYIGSDTSATASGSTVTAPAIARFAVCKVHTSTIVGGSGHEVGEIMLSRVGKTSGAFQGIGNTTIVITVSGSWAGSTITFTTSDANDMDAGADVYFYR